MKKTIHRSDSRGLADHGWLKSRHTFSFAEYHDPERNRFGLLRVLNDDVVEPGMGFGSHPHDNMEIVSLPLTGALAHKDSEGNEHVINSGDVQIMSAGSGLYHSEYNASKSEPVNFLQIWVFPKAKDITPRYDQRTLNAGERVNSIQRVISPEKNGNTLWINQDAYFSLSTIEKGKKVSYNINKKGNGLYIFVMSGTVKLDGEILGSRDAIGLEDLDNIEMSADENSEILLIEVPMSL